MVREAIDRIGPLGRRAGLLHSSLLIVLTGLLLLLWLGRLRTPNIVLDDVPRIVQLQTVPLRARLFQPFNEHLAPWFQVVSTLTWELSGRKLAHSPLAFDLASYVPFLGCLGALWLLLRRELRSATAAWVALTVFATSPAYAECVYWYSASSFTWALFFSLLGLWFVGSSQNAGDSSRGQLLAAALCAALAPMASAIGLLGGVLGAIRIGLSRPTGGFLRPNPRCLWPLAGTAAYLAIGSLFRYQEVVSTCVRTNGSLISSLRSVVQAPSFIVLWGPLTRLHPGRSAPPLLLGLATLAGAGLIIHRYRSLRAEERRWVRIGAVMIGAGYTLIYFVRARFPGHENLIAVQRYHLFPCAGLAIVVGACLSDWLRRLDVRPAFGPSLAVALAASLVVVNGRLSHDSLLYFSLQSDQRPVMRSLDQLAESARAIGLTRAEVIDAFEPIEPRWSPTGGNILEMLPETSDRARADMTPREKRDRLLERLGTREREALLACSNITSHMLIPDAQVLHAVQQPLEPVKSLRLAPVGRTGHYRSAGWPAFLEYDLPHDPRPPVAVELDGLAGATTWELWWAHERSAWSPDRIVVLRPTGGRQTPGSWVVPLDRIPGLAPGRLRRVRLMARDKGPVALENLRLIR